MSNKDEVDKAVLKKYDLIQKLGEGAYGIVWKVEEKKTHAHLALKKIYDAFQNATDAQRTFREIMFLQELSEHENIVKLQNVIKAENNRDIYLVFEYMDTDLHAVIRAKILEDIHKHYIIYQLLKSMKFIHSANILHRDLKPSNLLLNSECLLKVADFGLARLISAEETANEVLTDYVATRWYRAPEILLGSTKYTKGVDMWSVGCIVGELLGGKPMFPGSSTLNQLERVFEVTGKPTADDLVGINSQFAETMLQTLPPPARTRTLAQMYPDASELELDLLTKLLALNPELRMSAEEALEHPLVAQFHHPESEISCDRVIDIPLDDNYKCSVVEYRNKLYEDIIRKKKENKARAKRIKEEKEKEKKERRRSSSIKKESTGSRTEEKKEKKEGGSKVEEKKEKKEKKEGGSRAK
eukprot:TRINITY_DN2497_c0_g1_i1.p1 TRINITY_DN2497_c0_g1~~TRINITY_DN2497_c0_g1_i1.p1  ORF type:complete len:413 (+),score=116.12 TRINITY_DN2497_c0_g1_i1:107-1345(+)